jgi:hypothetical protein
MVEVAQPLSGLARPRKPHDYQRGVWSEVGGVMLGILGEGAKDWRDDGWGSTSCVSSNKEG